MELDRTRGRIVLSRRAHLEIERRGQREQILSKLEVGAVVDATIASVQPYGAFADLGGLDGLIHVSDLSHGRVKSPADVVSVGQKVRVKVLKIERDQDPPRLSLGLKQTLEDPFHSEVQKLAPGAVVSGRVTRLETFGAFVELAPGVEGLVHISELAPERVHSVSKIVKPDEIVQVKVLSVDPATRRIALSLKAARAQAAETDFTRADDAEVRRAREALMKKFGGNLKGGLG